MKWYPPLKEILRTTQVYRLTRTDNPCILFRSVLATRKQIIRYTVERKFLRLPAPNPEEELWLNMAPIFLERE